MTEWWEARHVALHNPAIVVSLLPQFSASARDSFKNKRLLSHPNILSGLEYFEQDGSSFVALNYIDGTPLEAHIRSHKGLLSAEEIFSMASDILSALDYMHSLGMNYGRLSRWDILIDQNGRAHLDGVRYQLEGFTMVVCEFTSPEQILRPKMVDARADIYSFGGVLYAMLSGKHPFSGEEDWTTFQILERQLEKAPAPLEFLNPAIPSEVGDVVFKCLEKEPDKRFQNCNEIVMALQKALCVEPAAR